MPTIKLPDGKNLEFPNKTTGLEVAEKISKSLAKQAMVIGTAGLTALACSFAIKAREELLLGEKVKDVLVTGASGGV